MSKKRIFFVLLSGLLLGTTGCSEVQDLTEDETTLVAEYAADLLLQYDVNYTDRVEEGQDAEAELATEETSETVEESTEAPTTTEQETGRDVSGKLEDAEVPAETEVVQEQDIAKIVGADGASITYKDYVIAQQYPATDEEGQFIYLDASSGYQLLVVRFRVTCTGDAPATVSLMDQDIDYRLVCNGSKAANPMLTILTNDLGTLETTVGVGEEQEAVLVFQISDSMVDQIQSAELYVNYNNIEHVVNIV